MMSDINLPDSEADYLHALNEAQRGAVDALDGPILVLAGAGTGKTRVLTTRLAHILSLGLARPNEILAVTFTNKAAKEMRARVTELIGPQAESMWIGTFHSLSVRFMRTHAERLGLRPDFTILDQDDQHRLVKQILEARDIDHKKFPRRAVLSIIQRWKDQARLPDQISRAEAGAYANGQLIQIYEDYQDRLKTLNAVDFGDLILRSLELLQHHPDVAKAYQQQFRYLLVDEYQDTNVAQYLWLRILAAGHKNICCVGDDDQSIYGWRGAEIGNILRFEKDFEGAQIIRLEQNYRSSQKILDAASHLISHNKGRLGKTLWTERTDGDPVIVKACWDGDEEARYVGDYIENLYIKKQPLSEVAILVRAGFQTREFEERFITMGIPYRVVGGARFYERMEIRDAMAYLRVVAQPSDGLAFERIVNTPKRNLGDAAIQSIHYLARQRDISLPQAALEILETEELRPQARSSLRKLMDDFTRWRSMVEHTKHSELAQIILDESGYTGMWQASKELDGPTRLENLKELISAMQEYDSLHGFLEHVSLVMDNANDNSGDQVFLMTLHSAKGLEFDTVFLPGWEEGLFPHQRALDENGGNGLEEERRLAFVGITRAKHQAIITHVTQRRIHNQWHTSLPSRFIAELPLEAIEKIGQPMRHQNPRVSWHNVGQNEGSWKRGHDLDLKASSSSLIERPSKFSRGERVFHQKFGYGTVSDIEGDRLTINFQTSGLKKVLQEYVKAVA